MFNKALSKIKAFFISIAESIAWARMKQVEAMMYRDCKNIHDIERLQKQFDKKSNGIHWQ
jgi:hypothetical protein